MKTITQIALLLILTGCTALDPRSAKDISAGWDDWELCQRLADVTYKGKSKWIWHITSEIKARNLHESPKCKTVYDARIAVYIRKQRSSKIQITFGQALTDGAPSFENTNE